MDMYSLFAFLGKTVVRPLHDIADFKAKIEQPIKNKRAKIGLARLSIVLQAIMLRRVKTQLINGRPLLQLPKREVIESKGPFLDESVLFIPLGKVEVAGLLTRCHSGRKPNSTRRLRKRRRTP